MKSEILSFNRLTDHIYPSYVIQCNIILHRKDRQQKILKFDLRAPLAVCYRTTKFGRPTNYGREVAMSRPLPGIKGRATGVPILLCFPEQ